MKKTTKKNLPTSSRKKAVKNLEVRGAKVSTVRGGLGKGGPVIAGWDLKGNNKV